MANKLWEARRKAALANKPIVVVNPKQPKRQPVHRQAPGFVKQGVGTNLTKIYSWFGVEHTSSCGCSDMETRMNNWGPEVCKANMEVILKHIHKECNKAGIPYIKAVQIRLVRLAIKWEVKRLAKLTVS